MRYFWLLTVGLLLFSCKGESAHNDREQTVTPAQAADQAVSASNPPVAVSQPPLKLSGSYAKTSPGQEVCITVSAANFSMLLSMQYTMRWDPKVLTFKEVRNFGLPYLGPDSFGAHRTKEGILTFVWIDNDLKGVTVADGGALYQVCFTATGKAGQSSYFRFSGDPTALEVVNLAEKVIGLETQDGGVKVQ
ncbi:MAG TPA: cohesin domain-containing protein [Flavilitoribacter sp.]|nr:cohesin domain-containing protein [Flavilitoribacter sp.]HMQ90882.1 cohesin domain-containing protein [Flavilitoribacter sp.]